MEENNWIWMLCLVEYQNGNRRIIAPGLRLFGSGMALYGHIFGVLKAKSYKVIATKEEHVKHRTHHILGYCSEVLDSEEQMNDIIASYIEKGWAMVSKSPEQEIG